MSLGKNIKELRRSTKLTQDELAGIINRRYNVKINKAMLSKWENDKEIPNLMSVKCLALFFGVTLDYLLDLSTNDQNPSNIMASMNQLNEEGQRKVIDYAEDLVASGKYSKPSSPLSPSRARKADKNADIETENIMNEFEKLRALSDD